MDGNCTRMYHWSFIGTVSGCIHSGILLPSVDDNGVHHVTLTGDSGITENDHYSGSIAMNGISPNLTIETSFGEFLPVIVVWCEDITVHI